MAIIKTIFKKISYSALTLLFLATVTFGPVSRAHAQDSTSSAAGSAGSCLIGQTFASFVSGAISSLTTKAVTTATQAALSVPVFDLGVNTNTAQSNSGEATLISKDVGIPIFGIPITPSLDAIGYCIVNALIEFIADSTINWINSGFEGNPVFIDNFDSFFKDLADRELSEFLQNVTLPGYVCEPFQIDIQLGLLNNRTNQRDPYSSYRNNQNSGSTGVASRGKNQCGIGEFLTYVGRGDLAGELGVGGGSYLGGLSGGGGTETLGNGSDGILAYQEGDTRTVRNAGFAGFLIAGNPMNTPLGAYDFAQSQVSVQQSSAQEIAKTEVVVNEGVHSPKDEDGNIETPGKIIQAEIENRLGLEEDRLVLADEFDEVLTALVNALVKIALDEILPDGTSRFVDITVDGENISDQAASAQEQRYGDQAAGNAADNAARRAQIEATQEAQQATAEAATAAATAVTAQTQGRRATLAAQRAADAAAAAQAAADQAVADAAQAAADAADAAAAAQAAADAAAADTSDIAAQEAAVAAQAVADATAAQAVAAQAAADAAISGAAEDIQAAEEAQAAADAAEQAAEEAQAAADAAEQAAEEAQAAADNLSQ